jgi:nitroreductase
MIETITQGAVDAAINSRRSIRAFLPTPVEREEIQQILEVASRAPSGTNIQPWKVYVLTGPIKDRVSQEILMAHNDSTLAQEHQPEYHYYPLQWDPPYIDRRRKVGWDLYGLLNLKRENKVGMHAQHGRNYIFFDAPVGLIFTIDRALEKGSWLDYGMFLQNIMVAARGRGLDTCPQAAFLPFHRILREVLHIPEQETIVCGMSLGFADSDKVENALQTERAPVSEFAIFLK